MNELPNIDVLHLQGWPRPITIFFTALDEGITNYLPTYFMKWGWEGSEVEDMQNNSRVLLDI